MNRVNWSVERLRRLFERYNRIYWRGKLSGYRVVMVDLSANHAIGYCNRREKRIEIDIDQHTSDHEVRATLLHEMAHAAAREPGHSVRFFYQMERLIRLGAPVTVSSPEAGQARILQDIVPKRFPMLRAKMQRVENRRQRKILKASKGQTFSTVTDDMIVGDFKDAALEGTWRQALIFLGRRYGLTDDIGRPVNEWARRIVRRAERVFRQARRDYLQDKKWWAAFSEKTK